VKQLMQLTVNGRRHEVAVPTNITLTTLLREELGYTGVKAGCGEGECGTCTVLLDGLPVSSCNILALDVDGREITTIEGLAHGAELHPIQQAFIEQGSIQCGFCTPGMILTAKALLDRNPPPSAAEVRDALSGNLCRCTGYQKIVEGVLDAADRLAAKKGGAR